MYPDQSLYPVNSVPAVVRRINTTLTRADQIQQMEGSGDIDYFAPIVADAEAGFGGVLNAFELMKAMIDAGAAGVHFEDQLASVKKCGHMGGKVLVPTREAVEKLVAARLAADCMGVPTVILARTDAEAADLVTSDIDDNDRPFCTGERTVEGFYKTRNGLDQAVSRGLAYAPVRRPALVRDRQARPRVRQGVRRRRSTRSSRARCWPTTARPRSTGRRTSTTRPSREFQRELGAMGYKFQFITLAGFHSLNYSMFNLAHGYARNQMSAFVELQEAEFAAVDEGLHRGQAPARSGHRLLRRRDADDPGRTIVDHRAQGLDRGRAVLRKAQDRIVGRERVGEQSDVAADAARRGHGFAPFVLYWRDGRFEAAAVFRAVARSANASRDRRAGRQASRARAAAARRRRTTFI